MMTDIIVTLLNTSSLLTCSSHEISAALFDISYFNRVKNNWQPVPFHLTNPQCHVIGINNNYAYSILKLPDFQNDKIQSKELIIVL